ncbi:IS1/IS1595 family N-terminal zinc-binding domain-containing protein [Stenomitos frigidus]
MDEAVTKVMTFHYFRYCLSKNGHRYNKQRYLCKDCGKQFLERTH